MTDLKIPIINFLKIIREDHKIRKQLIEAAPEITDKIYSFYQNSNCTCKTSIAKWVEEHVESVNTIIDGNIETVEIITKEISKAAEIAKKVAEENQSGRQPDRSKLPAGPAGRADTPGVRTRPANSISGKVFIIPRSDEAYANLIVGWASKSQMYRGLTVVESVVSGTDVWKIFTY